MSQVLCSSLLQSWGWQLPSEREIRRFADPYFKKIIVVISHTSYWDFSLLMMYRQADPRIKKHLHLVVKPQAFDSWGWALRPMGCVPATRAEDSGNGFVEKTVEQFQDKDIRLIISPEGKLDASEWKSGYYHIAKKLRASVMVAGLDYKKKRLYFGKIHSFEDVDACSKEQFEDVLMEEMSNIIPLHPERSHVNAKSEANGLDPHNFVMGTRSFRVNDLEPVQRIPFILTIVFFLALIIALIATIVITAKRRK
jgi:Acyltransferase